MAKGGDNVRWENRVGSIVVGVVGKWMRYMGVMDAYIYKQWLCGVSTEEVWAKH